MRVGDREMVQTFSVDMISTKSLPPMINRIVALGDVSTTDTHASARREALISDWTKIATVAECISKSNGDGRARFALHKAAKCGCT